MIDDRYVPGIGPAYPQLMIIGEAPFINEVEVGKPFVGSSGRELDTLLSDAGIHRNQCWVTNVCKYFVPASPKGKKIPFHVRAEQAGIDLKKQLEELQVEIKNVNPNCILALGGTALWALTGKKSIQNYRGSILYGMGCKVVPTYHPAHLLHAADGEIKGYWNRQVMVFDIKRAITESQSNKLELPQRNLIVCRDSSMLYNFIKRHKGLGRPSIDIEALNCIPSCIGLAYTPHEGISVPLWNTKGISKIPDGDLTQCWILLAEMLAESNVIGQNFKYDHDKIRRLGFEVRSVISDTMLKAFAINPELPKGLAFNTSIYTREPYYKDEGADFDISKQSVDDLYIYNARDACVTKEIDLAMENELDELGTREYYENFIMQLHPLYLDIETHGFRIDPEARKRLIEKYIAWDERLRFELFQIAGTEINVNSNTKDVPMLLYDIFKLPRKQGTGEEVLTELLNQKNGAKLPEHRRGIELVLEDRRVRKTISTYMMALPDFDGRMKTTYYICLETGRTATGQQEPPIRPLVEVRDEDNKKKWKPLGIAFQTITKHGDIGADVREQYIPDKDEIFLQADSSQAEARVVFLLADDEQALRDIDEHDYHALTASWFFGGTESDYSKKVLGFESPIRFAGKTLRHAGHLGATKRRAATELNTQARKYKIDISISESTAEIALATFHRKQPKIQQVFQAGIIEALRNNKRILTGPVPYGVNASIGGRRTFFERWGDELFRQSFSYIPQRAVTDNTKAAALRIKKRIPSIKIIMEAHDALLFGIKIKKVEEYAPIIREEFERPIRFENCSLPRRDLVIPCEIELGENYCHFKKFKFKDVKVA